MSVFQSIMYRRLVTNGIQRRILPDRICVGSPRFVSDDNSDPPNDPTKKINDILKMMIEQKNKPAPEKKKVTLPNENLAEFADLRKKARTAKKPKDTVDQLKEAAAAVAETLGGDKAETEKEILSKAMGETTPPPSNLDWKNLIAGMEIETTKSPDESRAYQVKSAFSRRRRTFQEVRFGDGKPTLPTGARMTHIDLFGGKPMGIFKNITGNEGTKLNVWKNLEEYELELATTHPPNNYFEKMIRWTKEGKIWKFPIDNEQGFEEEKSVHFSEHIFLETHLEGWCPERGPIRHFMELVCVGLSKNPYITVKDKKEHIMWFKDYFESKRQLLTEVGAYDKIDTQKSLPS